MQEAAEPQGPQSAALVQVVGTRNAVVQVEAPDPSVKELLAAPPAEQRGILILPLMEDLVSALGKLN